MVERQLRRRGIGDERVLAAMEAVPRDLFVPESQRPRAYEDRALPIGHGQTISQPWIVAAICEALSLEGGERVFEVGTGSGYSAAVLARLAAEVVTVERIEALARGARELLAELGVGNVEVVVGDGTAPPPGRGPFEAIAVHASAPSPPLSLIAILAPGGRLVIPIATESADMLTRFVSTGETDAEGVPLLTRESLGACRFVPLIGREGFDPGPNRPV